MESQNENKEENLTKSSSCLDKIEQIARISSYIIVPIVIGIGSYLVKQSIATQNTNKKYVEIALSILTEDSAEIKNEKAEKQLKKWAVNLLDSSSPVPMSEQTRIALISGEEFLPKSLSFPQEFQKMTSQSKNKLVKEYLSTIGDPTGSDPVFFLRKLEKKWPVIGIVDPKLPDSLLRVCKKAPYQPANIEGLLSSNLDNGVFVQRTEKVNCKQSNNHLNTVRMGVKLGSDLKITKGESNSAPILIIGERQ